MEPSCQVCPRCGMHFMNGVAYPSHSNKPQSGEWVAQKVCQFAHRQDGSVGDHPVGCINPSYNCFYKYGPFDDSSDLEQGLNRALGNDPPI